MSESDAKINGSRVEMKIPLEDYTREVAREAAREAAREVLLDWTATRKGTCPQDPRIGRVERTLIMLVAFLAGLGILNIWALLKG